MTDGFDGDPTVAIREFDGVRVVSSQGGLQVRAVAGKLFSSERALLVALPATAAAMPLLDEVGHHLIGSALVVHLVLSAAGGAIAATLVLAFLRLRRSREALARETRADEEMIALACTIARADHARAVLDRLAEQACRTLEIGNAVVFLRAQDQPETVVAAAGHGVEDMVGRRFAASEGAFGQVLATGKPVLLDEYWRQRSPLSHRATTGLHAAGSVPIRTHGGVVGALSAGTVDPERKFGDRELRVLSTLADLGGLALEHADMRHRLEVAVRSGVEAFAAAVEARDSPTGRHCEEVVGLARRVGERLGLGGEALGDLEFAARLHDVGKISVPDSILRKPGCLDEREWKIMRSHPVWGADLLERIPGLEPVAKIVRAAHERWDGRGYPDGLRGTQIPFASRIILACDAYDAMTSKRPYRPPMGRAAALRELRENAGTQFDPEVVAVLVSLVSDQDTSAARPAAGAAVAGGSAGLPA